MIIAGVLTWFDAKPSGIQADQALRLATQSAHRQCLKNSHHGCNALQLKAMRAPSQGQAQWNFEFYSAQTGSLQIAVAN